jgi:hypothetical protein
MLSNTNPFSILSPFFILLFSQSLPSIPLNLRAFAGDAQATVTFSKPDRSGASPISGFDVIARPSAVQQRCFISCLLPANAGPSCVECGDDLRVVVTGLSNGQAYTFAARAFSDVGTGGESFPSNEVLAFGAPSAPFITSAQPGRCNAINCFRFCQSSHALSCFCY